MPGLRRVLASACALLLAAPLAGAERLVDGIAAQVGSEIVLYSEVIGMVGDVERRMREAGAPEGEIAKLRAEGLERLIEWRLIEKVVQEGDLYATEEEIDGTIESIARQNQLTKAQLRTSVTAHGMSYESYRAQIAREIERRKVVGMMVGSRIRVEESEVRVRYTERYGEQPDGGTTVHLRQILVPTDPDAGRSRQAACGAVQQAQSRIAAGERFEQVASEVSLVAPERGGDLGWVHLDTAAPWMVRVVDTLQPGETSDVLDLPFGCGLLQLVERRDFQPVTWEQVKASLEQEIYDEKVAEEFGAWLEELRGQTYIERKGYFADAAGLLRPSLDSGN